MVSLMCLGTEAGGARLFRQMAYQLLWVCQTRRSRSINRLHHSSRTTFAASRPSPSTLACCASQQCILEHLHAWAHILCLHQESLALCRDLSAIEWSLFPHQYYSVAVIAVGIPAKASALPNSRAPNKTESATRGDSAAEEAAGAMRRAQEAVRKEGVPGWSSSLLRTPRKQSPPPRRHHPDKEALSTFKPIGEAYWHWLARLCTHFRKAVCGIYFGREARGSPCIYNLVIANFAWQGESTAIGS